ncbi:MAG TPA: MATE family efflux transporter [Dehalococcoidia bacterium]|nr:MATE family efflux transporter [Dehalococcoidia bacterium]
MATEGLRSGVTADTSADGITVAEAAPEERARGRRRSEFVDRNLTEGSIPKNLAHLAWPQVVESVVNVTDQLADLVWAGRLGAESVAGLGVAQTYVQVARTGRQGLDTAMRAMVSRAIGAGDVARANHVALQAFTLSGAFSLLMVLVGVFLTEPLLRVLGVPESVIIAGADYMRWNFVGTGAVAFRMMSGAALQASGDTLTPMKATMVSRVLHVALSPAFVFGWWLFPEWGLVGTAVANTIAQGAGVVMNFRALFTGTSRLHLTFAGYRPDLPLLWRLIKTGAPASVTSAERAFAQLVLVGLVAPYGATTLAAFSLTRRIEMLSHVGAGGIGQSTGVMVGQNLGAGKHDRARKSVLWGLVYVNISTFIACGLMFAFPREFLSFFNDDPELLDVAVKWLQIALIGYLVMGMGMVFMQSYNTAGDTLVPMVVTLISIWGIQQPLAVVLPDLGLEQYGIAWAIVAAMAARLLIYVPYFFSDRWERVRL